MAQTRRKKPAAVPPTVAPEPPPAAYVIPTDLLVQTIRLVGAMPAAQVGLTLHQLQRLEPHVAATEPLDAGE